ncbi:hypothetical protein [Chitinophaga agri]|uniref:Uncharacterized protein n=1 Tax=Chitinophaga agri TaxID=2703787 RepID=A0A6B9ZCE1_9BACT|nr:hypothetical protein [Chitinophaga agri]QHS59827.1 hypothetical protein GWR21_09555 [Chitinophaga agri]
MLTREELKTRCYNIFYEQEYAFEVEPTIEPTERYVHDYSYPIATGSSRIIFRESLPYRLGRLLIVLFFSGLVIAGVFNTNEEQSIQTMVTGVGVWLLVGIFYWRLFMKINLEWDMEISYAGMSLQGRSFTWEQILGTYFLRRKGTSEGTKLVLLLDNGEILHQEILHYTGFIRDAKRAVSSSIRHFNTMSQ